MQDVWTIKGMVVAQVSNYLMNQSRFTLILSSWAQHKYASGQ
jgi:hypothetical protein